MTDVVIDRVTGETTRDARDIEVGSAYAFGRGYEKGYSHGHEIAKVLTDPTSLATLLGVNALAYGFNADPVGGKLQRAPVSSERREHLGFDDMPDQLIRLLMSTVRDLIPEQETGDLIHRVAALAAGYAVDHPRIPIDKAMVKLIDMVGDLLEHQDITELSQSQLVRIQAAIIASHRTTHNYLQHLTGETS